MDENYVCHDSEGSFFNTKKLTLQIDYRFSYVYTLLKLMSILRVLRISSTFKVFIIVVFSNQCIPLLSFRYRILLKEKAAGTPFNIYR